MIRIELLTEQNGALFTVGLHQFVEDNFFDMRNLDTQPQMVNRHTLNFSSQRDGTHPLYLTHIGFFPDVEYTGIVSRLTAPLTVKKGEQAGFKAGSISIFMTGPDMGVTVTKGKP